MNLLFLLMLDLSVCNVPTLTFDDAFLSTYIAFLFKGVLVQVGYVEMNSWTVFRIGRLIGDFFLLAI